MNVEIILYVLLLVIIGVGVTCIIGASIYDLKQAYRNSTFAKIPGKKKNSSHITILIYIQNTSYGLESSLRSIASNRYRYTDVVVVDNMSGKIERRKIKDIIAKVSTQKIYFYKNRHKVSKDHAIKEGYKRSMHGDLVLLIAPSHILPPRSLSAIAKSSTTVYAGLHLVLPLKYLSPLSLEASYIQLKLATLDIQSKLRAMAPRARIRSLIIGSVYTKSMLEKNTKMPVKSHYVSELPLVISSQAAWTDIKQRDTIFAIFIRIFVTIITLICLWVATTTDSNQPLLIIWCGITAWLVSSVSQTIHISFRTKLHLLSSAWLAMFVFTAMNILRIRISSTENRQKA